MNIYMLLAKEIHKPTTITLSNRTELKVIYFAILILPVCDCMKCGINYQTLLLH